MTILRYSLPPSILSSLSHINVGKASFTDVHITPSSATSGSSSVLGRKHAPISISAPVSVLLASDRKMEKTGWGH
jgi:hypothetical protein